MSSGTPRASSCSEIVTILRIRLAKLSPLELPFIYTSRIVSFTRGNLLSSSSVARGCIQGSERYASRRNALILYFSSLETCGISRSSFPCPKQFSISFSKRSRSCSSPSEWLKVSPCLTSLGLVGKPFAHTGVSLPSCVCLSMSDHAIGPVEK